MLRTIWRHRDAIDHRHHHRHVAASGDGAPTGLRWR
jgi:hypothetical protein